MGFTDVPNKEGKVVQRCVLQWNRFFGKIGRVSRGRCGVRDRSEWDE